MAVQSGSFVLYMVAAATLQVFMIIVYVNINQKTIKNSIISDIACNGASFIA